MKYLTTKEIAEKWGISDRTVRRYCAQELIAGVKVQDNHFLIPEWAEQPSTKEHKNTAKKLTSLAKRVIYEKEKNNHFGIYEYIQVNLTYSSNRMASNRLTREQVMELFRTNKISPAFEPMKVDDLIETINHFACVRMVVDNIQEPLSIDFIRRLHHTLYYGTYADRKQEVLKGELRTAMTKRGCVPNQIRSSLLTLIKNYETIKNPTMEDLLEFHVRFEKICPFTDGNGRVGRLILLKECLRQGVDPFLIDDKRRGAYNNGITSWEHDKSILTETCVQAQQRFQAQRELLKLMQYCKQKTTMNDEV